MISKRIKLAILSLSTILCASFVGCSKTMTYSDYQENQDEAIEKFIKNHNIAVEGSLLPDTGNWVNTKGQEVYALYASGKAKGLYYHQVRLGDGAVPQDNWTAFVRYVGYKLDGNMQYNCTAQYSPDPQCFKLTNDASSSTFGTGFQQAVKNLRVGGKCKVIIPFKIGNGSNIDITGTSYSDMSEYRPMYYEIELVGLE